MTDQAVSIREMVEADLPGNAALQHLQMEYHLPWMGPIDYEWIASEACTQRTRDFIGQSDHLALVAEQDGRPVGFLLGKIRDNHPTSLNKKIGDLASLFVHEDLRGLGVGKRLCDRFKSYCRDRNVVHITVEAASSNYPTHDFYHRLGYEDYSVTMRLKVMEDND
jgi:ribosomal protein S18 acetylase RimI-like enzyme